MKRLRLIYFKWFDSRLRIILVVTDCAMVEAPLTSCSCSCKLESILNSLFFRTEVVPLVKGPSFTLMSHFPLLFLFPISHLVTAGWAVSNQISLDERLFCLYNQLSRGMAGFLLHFIHSRNTDCDAVKTLIRTNSFKSR